MNSENEPKRCLGCGVILQEENILQEGYITSLENDICQRCFRMKNYGEYQVVTKSNEEYIEILKNVGRTKDLVLYITDLLNLEEDFNSIRSILPNKMILVLNKKDALPKSVKEKKLIKYLEDMKIQVEEVIVISCAKNYNIDYLLKRIKYYQTSKNVYVVGHTNAGKSSLINKLIQNYSNNPQELTMSPLPSTTLNTVNIEINEYLTLIDTPGLLDDGNIIDYVDINTMKKIVPNKEIKPRTYQVKVQQTLFIDNLVRLDIEDNNNLTFYISNMLEVERTFKDIDKLKDLKKYELDVKKDNDIVISGLGFIKCTNSGHITLYTLDKVLIYIRESLI